MVAEAWYRGPSEREPSAPHDADDVYRGLVVPGQMTDGARLRYAIQQADELGLESQVIYVDRDHLPRYVLLRQAVGYTLRPWREPLGPCAFVFRDARRAALAVDALRADDV